MNEFTSFHFIRPEYLLLIPVLLLFTGWLTKQNRHHTGFEGWIDQPLLQHLRTQDQHRHPVHSQLPYWLLALAWVMTSIILSGPTWKQLPQPLHQSEQAVVIILDLSPSMRATDNKPSRIARARLKIQALLTQRKEGLTALIVYAGEAHIVTPLTNDTKTIINLLPTLTPGLLPLPGSNIEMAMATATQLVNDSGLHSAAFILVTDGIVEEALSDLTPTHTPLFIIGMGTNTGAPIPINVDTTQNQNAKTAFLRDKNERIITATRDENTLKQFAHINNGHYLPLQADNSDIAFISERLNNTMNDPVNTSKSLDMHMDQWDEFGPTLLLLLLPLFTLMFRRGWILSTLLILTPVLTPEPAYAFSWNDLWLNKNQQAQQAFDQEDYQHAEKKFSHSQWQGSAAYKNKNYQAAVDAFRQGDTAADHYNRGNALSQLGRYDDALQAYDTALKKNPDLEDAKTNKALINALKKQQQKQQQGQGQEKKDDGNTKDHAQESSQNSNESPQSDHSQPQQPKKNDDPSSTQTPSTNTDKPTDENPESKSLSDKPQQDNDQKNAEKNAEKNTDKNRQNTNEKEENQDTPTEPHTEKNSALAKLSDEEKHELQQWIRKIPDDPSGLLRRKFNYEFQKRRQLYQAGKWKLPDNNAHERY